MIDTLKNQAPQWQQRPDTPLPFVLTVCTNGALAASLALIQDELGRFSIREQRPLSTNACDFDFNCTPTEAWSLLESLRAKLKSADVYLQPRDERPKRLLICDMDMTIVAAETLDEVAAELGVGDEISAITTRAMHGEIDFDDALRERIAILAGQPEQVFHDVAQSLVLNSGAEALLASAKAAGIHTILISGGFAQAAEPIGKRLGFDEVYCNHLEIESGQLTGSVMAPIVNADYKLKILQQRAQALGISPDECCAIGDGANDLGMIQAAGLGIAFHGKPVLRAGADCYIDATDLASVVFFMGLERADG